ncbi:hypothetical protein [Kaistella sp.]|uniref:hypothetical protein n=1 Tax=Kaistella sp. TaxID=2782235 RepID=UPI002F948EBF
MKRILLTIFFPFSFFVFGQQTDLKTGGNYYFDFMSKSELDSLEADVIDSNFSLTHAKEFLNGTDYKLTIKKIVGNKVYFTYWQFVEANTNHDSIINGSSNVRPKSLTNKDSKGTRVTYTLPVEIFKEATMPYYNRVVWRVGAFTIPFKLRFDGFAFDPNVNLGVNVGAKIRWNRKLKSGFALEPIFGISLSSIKLDNENSTTLESTTLSAFSTNIGVLTHVSESINIGITCGLDNLSNNDQKKYKWIHNAKPWLGVGINLAFGNNAENDGRENGN